MPVTGLLMEGVNLMLLGMGSVFIFLSILVLTMTGVSRLVQAISGDDNQQTTTRVAATPRAATSGGDELTAVISAAISRYRSR